MLCAAQPSPSQPGRGKMWLEAVSEALAPLNRGPFTLPSHFLFGLSFFLFCPSSFPSVSFSVCLCFSVPLSLSWALAWAPSPGKNSVRSARGGCAAQLFGTPSTKLGKEGDSSASRDPARPQNLPSALHPPFPLGFGRREMAAMWALRQLGIESRGTEGAIAGGVCGQVSACK